MIQCISSYFHLKKNNNRHSIFHHAYTWQIYDSILEIHVHMKKEVGEVFHLGHQKLSSQIEREVRRKCFFLLGIYCFVQYLISFLVIKKYIISQFFLLISVSHVITLNLFKSYFLSFHFLHPYHLSNTYKKKLKHFFLILSTFSILTFLSYQQNGPLRAPLVGGIIEKMKIRGEKNEEKVVGDGVWLRGQKNERKKGLNGKLSI